MNRQTRKPARLSLLLLPRNRSIPDSIPPLVRRPWNRSGDIPIIILVVGVMLICAMAIISFFSSTIKERNSFIGVELVEQMNADIEEKIFNNENPAGLYISKNMTEGFLFWQKEVLSFSAEYKFKP